MCLIKQATTLVSYIAISWHFPFHLRACLPPRVDYIARTTASRESGSPSAPSWIARPEGEWGRDGAVQ